MANVKTDLSRKFLSEVAEYTASPHFLNASLSERSAFVMGLFKGFLSCSQSLVHIDDLSTQHSLIQDAIYSDSSILPL